MRSVDLIPPLSRDRRFRPHDEPARRELPRRRERGYPPYNIEKTGDNAYRITMAVAGFGEQDIDVTVQENRLIIKASKEKDGQGALE